MLLPLAQPVQLRRHVQRVPLQPLVHPRRVAHMQNGIGPVPQPRAPVGAGHESARPQPRAPADPRPGRQHHKRRQVLRLTPQPVDRPRPDRWPARLAESRLEKQLRRRVVELVRLHRPHDAQLIRHRGGERQHLRDFRARLTVALELEPGPQHRRVRTDEGVPLARDHRRGQRFTLHLRQFGLVVEQVQLAGRPRHEQVDHPLRLRREMGLPGGQRVGLRRRTRPAAQARQGHRAQTQPGLAQKCPPGQLPGLLLHDRVHRFTTASSRLKSNRAKAV